MVCGKTYRLLTVQNVAGSAKPNEFTLFVGFAQACKSFAQLSFAKAANGPIS